MSQKGSELLLLGANVMGVDIEREREILLQENEKNCSHAAMKSLS